MNSRRLVKDITTEQELDDRIAALQMAHHRRARRERWISYANDVMVLLAIVALAICVLYWDQITHGQDGAVVKAMENARAALMWMIALSALRYAVRSIKYAHAKVD